MTTHTRIKTAIKESIMQDQITHLGAVTADESEQLLAECDDHAENGPVTEYWGEDEYGNPWRITTWCWLSTKKA